MFFLFLETDCVRMKNVLSVITNILLLIQNLYIGSQKMNKTQDKLIKDHIKYLLLIVLCVTMNIHLNWILILVANSVVVLKIKQRQYYTIG